MNDNPPVLDATTILMGLAGIVVPGQAAGHIVHVVHVGHVGHAGHILFGRNKFPNPKNRRPLAVDSSKIHGRLYCYFYRNILVIDCHRLGIF